MPLKRPGLPPTVALLVAAVLAPAAAPAVVSGQGFDHARAGNGPTAAGLGGAFTAIADDISAIAWNPAGLVQLERRQVAYSARFRLSYPTIQLNAPGVRRTERVWSYVPVPIDHAAIAIPLDLPFGRAAVAVAYRTFNDWNRSEDRRVVTSGFSTNITTTATGGGSAISPAVAVSLGQRLSVGTTVSILGGKWVRPAGVAPSYITGYPPYTRVEHEKIAGTLVEIGLLARPLARLSMGLRVGLPHERTWNVKTSLSGGGSSRPRRLEVPTMYGLGAAYDLGRDRRVSADVHVEPWTQATWYDAAADTVIADDYGDFDVVSFGLGFSQHIVAAGWRGREVLVTNRLGISVRPSSDADARGKRITRFGFSAGRSWSVNRSTVHIALVYRQSNRYDRSTATYTAPAVERELDMAVGYTFALVPDF